MNELNKAIEVFSKKIGQGFYDIRYILSGSPLELFNDKGEKEETFLLTLKDFNGLAVCKDGRTIHFLVENNNSNLIFKVLNSDYKFEKGTFFGDFNVEDIFDIGFTINMTSLQEELIDSEISLLTKDIDEKIKKLKNERKIIVKNAKKELKKGKCKYTI